MKPNQIIIPKAKKTSMLLPNFKAITWKGIIYCKKQSDVDSINQNDYVDTILKAHETIHIRQAYAMNNSWTKFYLNYMLQYIKNIPLITININAPYKLIPTEIEAYLNQDNLQYPSENKPLTQWKYFQKNLKLKDKKQIAKLYYKNNIQHLSYTSILINFLKQKQNL